MAKYESALPEIKFDKDGLADNNGWVQIYHASEITREYLGTSMARVIKSFGIAAHAYLDPPDVPTDNKAILRTKDGKKWEYVDDFRGKTVFNTDDQTTSTVDYPGEIKDGYTLLEPKTEFDKWDGKKWVTDKKLQKEQDIRLAESQKKSLTNEAENKIKLLERKSRLNMADDEEKATLNTWEIYSVKISEVDTSTAPNISWPEKPQ